MARWERLEARLRRRIARKVRIARIGLNLTLEEVADRAEMHWRHIQKIEAGTIGITLKTIARLALALDVEPSELLQ